MGERSGPVSAVWNRLDEVRSRRPSPLRRTRCRIRIQDLRRPHQLLRHHAREGQARNREKRTHHRRPPTPVRKLGHHRLTDLVLMLVLLYLYDQLPRLDKLGRELSRSMRSVDRRCGRSDGREGFFGAFGRAVGRGRRSGLAGGRIGGGPRLGFGFGVLRRDDGGGSGENAREGRERTFDGFQVAGVRVGGTGDGGAEGLGGGRAV